MELCFMKSSALDTLKNGLPQIFDKYLTQKDNSWLAEVCGENPFIKFRDVPDFELEPLDENFSEGKIDFSNSKILYKHLNFLTPRQAADERLWAGLCHGVFYDYVRRRWKYDKSDSLKKIDELRNRFFFNDKAREKLVLNTLAKYWWARHIFDDEALDILGANNFSTKIFSILTRSFIGNENLRKGFVKFLKHFKDRGFVLNTEKHIRPAMIELNVTGGAVILDCLSADEVAAIMIDYVEKIFSPKQSVDNTRTAEFGNYITIVSLDNGKQRVYKIDERLTKQFSYIAAELIGKAINSVVTIKDGKYKITDIK